MKRSARISLGLGAALVAGTLLSAPAGAQSLPIVPPVGAAVAGVAAAGAVVPAVPAAAGVVGIGGGQNVHVDKDTDRYRERGTVVID